MTTIIIDGDTKKVYSDSRSTTARTNMSISLYPFKIEKKTERRYGKGVEKIFLFENSVIVGTGNYVDVLRLKQHIVEGKNIPKKITTWTSVYQVYKGKEGLTVLEYTCNPKKILGFNIPTDIVIKKHVIGDKGYIIDGSGCYYAKGAISVGADPTQAIIAASKCDPYTDDNVVWIEIPGYF